METPMVSIGAEAREALARRYGAGALLRVLPARGT
jgi:hypothetical protein